MGLFLKQSTSATVMIGPFVDDGDGNTVEDGLTITQADVRLSKNAGNMAQKNEGTACTHDELGYYTCPLDTTDTNTLGRLQLMVHESGALPVYHEYMVVTANFYDSICSTDTLQADITQMGGVAQSATDLKDFADTGYDPTAHKVQGLVLCDTTTTNTDMVSQANITDILADTNEMQGKLPTNNIMGSSVKTDKDDEIDAIKAKTDNLPADPADDSDIDAAIAAVKADTAAILIDTNELQTDWVNGGRLDLLLDAAKEAVDTEVAAIKAVTDTLSLSAIADAVLDEVVDGNNPANANSLREVINVMSAALAGKSSGGGTATIKFRDLGDTKDRINATVTADGNRTAVTNDGT